MANLEEAQQKYVEIKTGMLLHTPFFASLLLDMMKVEIGKFPHLFPPGMDATAATDGKHIWYDEDFLATLKLPEAVFLTCHEIGHAMWEHMARAKKYKDTGFDGKVFNPGKWNRAGDYIINDMLVKARIGHMPKGGLLDSKFDHRTMNVDDVYRLLPDDPNDGNCGGIGGNGTLDAHIPSPNKTTAAEWRRAVQSAAYNAKAQGKLPASLARFVEQLLEPRINWQELLRTMLMRAASRDAHTWAKPHRRRLITQGVIMPSKIGFGAGTVVIAVDTSGSISQKELTVFLAETQNILDVAKPERVYFVPCDAEVHEPTELAMGDDLASNKPKIAGGGGTSFVPVFDWIKEHGINPAALVYLTDMIGNFPRKAPPYKTIWASTTKGAKAPFGQVVEVDLKEYRND